MDSIADKIFLEEQMCFLKNQSNQFNAVCLKLPGINRYKQYNNLIVKFKYILIVFRKCKIHS